jgi:ferritin
MIKPKLAEALNKQVNAEFYASYLYLSASAYLENEGLPGMARWMRAQYEEELVHALKIVDFLYERGGRIILESIAKPPAEFGTPLNVFEAALEHEQKVTAMIDDLYSLAVEEKDPASQVFLEWFVTEQVEEESNVSGVIDQLKMAGDGGPALLMMDRQLGERPATSITTPGEEPGADT